VYKHRYSGLALVDASIALLLPLSVFCFITHSCQNTVKSVTEREVEDAYEVAACSKLCSRIRAAVWSQDHEPTVKQDDVGVSSGSIWVVYAY
jgi:hypothetical protein